MSLAFTNAIRNEFVIESRLISRNAGIIIVITGDIGVTGIFVISTTSFIRPVFQRRER